MAGTRKLNLPVVGSDVLHEFLELPGELAKKLAEYVLGYASILRHIHGARHGFAANSSTVFSCQPGATGNDQADHHIEQNLANQLAGHFSHLCGRQQTEVLSDRVHHQEKENLVIGHKARLEIGVVGLFKVFHLLTQIVRQIAEIVIQQATNHIVDTADVVQNSGESVRNPLLKPSIYSSSLNS